MTPARPRTALLAGLVAIALVSVAVAASADPGGDKMTICHKPGTSDEHTLRVSRSAWSGHRGHGDHEGACTDEAARAATGGAGGGGDDEPPQTVVWIAQEAEGRVDGRATFEVTIANAGDADALDVTVAGKLRGGGRWSVRDDGGADCAIEDGALSCEAGTLPAGERLVLVLRYEGGATLCQEPRTYLTVSSSNDATTDDDQSDVRTRAGVCAAPGSLPP